MHISNWLLTLVVMYLRLTQYHYSSSDLKSNWPSVNRGNLTLNWLCINRDDLKSNWFHIVSSEIYTPSNETRYRMRYLHVSVCDRITANFTLFRSNDYVGLFLTIVEQFEFWMFLQEPIITEQLPFLKFKEKEM